MPQLTVRGIDAGKLAAVSGLMVEELARVCECGTDNFTVDCLKVTSVFGGGRVDTYPFVEVAWFERGAAIRDAFADAVTRHVRAIGIAEVEIAFKVYTEDAYYINGVACSS